ncbi:hypothetical protein CGG91_19315 [Vibrio parahaemolyticus]|nr:hypothetical protein CGG91_19315 [Vibrio parahaemolyticus]
MDMTKHSKIFAGVASAIALTSGVSAWAASDQDFNSMQMKGVEQIEVKVDLDGAAKRLSKVVQFPTISNQDRSDFSPDVYTITAIQLENTTEFEGFHGVNERIRVDEYGRSIGFFYQLMDNLDNL